MSQQHTTPHEKKKKKLKTFDYFTASNAIMTIVNKADRSELPRQSKPSKSKYGFRLMEPTNDRLYQTCSEPMKHFISTSIYIQVYLSVSTQTLNQE